MLYLPKLGTNTLPDELQSHFANIFHKKPVSFRLFINRKFVSFAFFKILLDIDCWLWTKITDFQKSWETDNTSRDYSWAITQRH